MSLELKPTQAEILEPLNNYSTNVTLSNNPSNDRDAQALAEAPETDIGLTPCTLDTYDISTFEDQELSQEFEEILTVVSSHVVEDSSSNTESLVPEVIMREPTLSISRSDGGVAEVLELAER
ncbi:hypothetical protein BGZ94_010097, partial [Podila epigama]